MTLEQPPMHDTSRSSLERVFDALDAGGFSPDKHANAFTALCPVHGDTHRSLSVRYDPRSELTMLHCFACNATIGDITAAIGITVADTFDKPLPPKADRPKRRGVAFRPAKKLPARIAQERIAADDLEGASWKRVTTYTYADATGTTVQQVFREHAIINGVTHKRFTQRFRGPSGRMVARKPADFTPALYRHADVVDAIATGKTVWVVEGEKDADNAAAHGLIATTNAQGASSFPEELADVFTGGTINVIADRDTAGYKRANALHQMLTARGATVRLLRPAIAENKADLSDHLEAGLDVDALEEISAEDASVLAQLGEAQKLLTQVQICVDEVRAHRAAGGDELTATQHTNDAEAWAHEAEERMRRLVEAAGGSTRFVDAFGPAGRAAIEEIATVTMTAAKVAAEAHELAGVTIPRYVADRLPKPAGADEAARLRDAGDAAEPPIFRGNDFARDDDGSPNTGTEYIVRQGETVQVKIEKDGDGYRNRFQRIIRGWAEIQNIAVDDDGGPVTSTRATHQVKATFHRWIRDAKGKPVLDDDNQPTIESQSVTWDADQLRDGSWAQALPWPGMLESTSRRGKDNAWDAIFNARPAPTTRTTVYVTTGWRDGDTGPFFIHNGGAIAKGGALDVATGLPDAFAPFTLPSPLSEAAALREAWRTGTLSITDQLPARVAAPLLGVVWRSVFERVPFITHLVGGRAAYKTSTARLACQYFAPDLHFRGRREILSGSNMGGTTIGLIRALATTNHLPVLIDDVAPDGNAKKAQQKLSELARLIYNETGRVTGKQRGGISTDQPTKATVITTGELAATGSAQTRMLSIPLDPGALAKGSETFAELERPAARRARGELGASLIRWIAEHRSALLAEAETLSEDPNSNASAFTRWRARLADLPHDGGLKDRLTEAAIAAEHGIRLMLRMMTTSGALNHEEADQFMAWAEEGIFQAVSLQDSSAGDPAEQLLGYLREALASGNAHLTDEDGSAPENSTSFGWSIKGRVPNDTLVANGPRIGVIKNDRVYLIPSSTIGAVNQVAQRADESFAETSVSISSAMAARGWLEVDSSGKRGVGRRIDGTLMRVWDMPLTVLVGADGDSPEGTNEADQPDGPQTPALFDDSDYTPAPQPAPAPAEQPSSQPTPAQPQPAAVQAQPVATPQPRSDVAITQQRTAPARAGNRTQPSFRASVAVLHTDGLWLPDGEQIQLQQPIRHLGDIAKLIAQVRLGTVNGKRREDGQILVTREAAVSIGIPIENLTEQTSDITKELKALTTGLPFISDALEAGYNVSGGGKFLNATTRVWTDENRDQRGRFVLIPALKNDFATITNGITHPAEIARRLQKFADALHFPYAMSASTTGVDLMQRLRSRDESEVFYAPSDPVEPALITTLERDINWTRKPTEEELTHTYVHAYDRGASYLAGVGSCELGIGLPTYFPDGRAFDKKLPGYWRIPMPERAEWMTPNPLDPRDLTEGGAEAGAITWVSTPTLEVAIELGYEPQILEAYVWETHGRILDTWYQRVSGALTELDTNDVDDQAARKLLKSMYVEGLGLMASHEYYKGRPGYAPERYHAIQARARANIMRRVFQIGHDTGRWPVAIMRDTVLYTSNEPDPETAWPGKPEHFGRRPGQYKYERSAHLAEHVEFLNGGRYRGKDALDMEIF